MTEALTPTEPNAATGSVAQLLALSGTAALITYTGSVTRLHGHVLGLTVCRGGCCAPGTRVSIDVLLPDGAHHRVGNVRVGSFVVGEPAHWEDTDLAAVVAACESAALFLAEKGLADRAEAARVRGEALRAEIGRRALLASATDIEPAS